MNHGNTLVSMNHGKESILEIGRVRLRRASALGLNGGQDGEAIQSNKIGETSIQSAKAAPEHVSKRNKCDILKLTH